MYNQTLPSIHPLVPFNALGAKFFFLLAILEAIWYKNMLPLNCPNDIERLQERKEIPLHNKNFHESVTLNTFIDLPFLGQH